MRYFTQSLWEMTHARVLNDAAAKAYVESVLGKLDRIKLQDNGRYALIRNRDHGDGVIVEHVPSDTGAYFPVITGTPSSKSNPNYWNTGGITVWEGSLRPSALPENRPLRLQNIRSISVKLSHGGLGTRQVSSV